MSFILIVVLLFIQTSVFAQDRLFMQTPPHESLQQTKISLDIKGMDIVDVLKMLAVRAGINIVVGKNVTGRVTLFLKDVDVWDAFEIILLANDLAYEKKGEIFSIMTQRDYELIYGERYQDKKQVKIIPLRYAKAIDLSRALNQIKTSIGKVIVDESSNTLLLIDTPEALKNMDNFIKETDLPVKTQIFSLNYAQADKLSIKLQEVITKGVGSIKVDERTNKLAITDYPQKLNEIAKIINALDEKTPQVLIDAQIIEIKPSDKFEMGFNFDYWIKKYIDIKASIPINSDNAFFIGTPNTTPTEKDQYKAIMDILRTVGETNILSSPRIMALNNQEAKIHVGTKEAYITSTTSQGASGNTVTAQSVNFVDTGITLYVTPTINRHDFVTMKIKPEISDAESKDILSEGQKTTVPIVTSSDAETTVMVKDGVTIVIGGLKKDKREKTTKELPFFGRIPVLGYLFRSTSDNLTTTDLVILLTPHIISGESSYTTFSEILPKDGAVAKMVKGNIVTEKIVSKEKTLKKANADIEYYKLLSSRIQALVSFDRPEEEKGQVKLTFTLLNDGRLIGEPVILKSDNSVLNSFAIRAVKSASPFPSFPEELDKTQQCFSVTIDYR